MELQVPSRFPDAREGLAASAGDAEVGRLGKWQVVPFQCCSQKHQPRIVQAVPFCKIQEAEQDEAPGVINVHLVAAKLWVVALTIRGRSDALAELAHLCRLGCTCGSHSLAWLLLHGQP